MEIKINNQTTFAQAHFMICDEMGVPVARSMELDTALKLLEVLCKEGCIELRAWTIMPDNVTIAETQV